MNKLKTWAVLLVCICFFAQTVEAQITNPAPYCECTYDNDYNMLGSVTVNGGTHTIGPAGGFGQQAGYRYFNTQVFPDMTIGANNTISFVSYAVNDGEPIYFAVYIDINHNNTFDADEVFMQNNNTINAALNTFGQNAPQTISKMFTIPNTALPGQTRMRVVRGQHSNTTMLFVYSPTYTLAPCHMLPPPVVPGAPNGDNSYGICYDYNVTLTGGVPATPPVAAFSANPTTAIINTTNVVLTDQSTNTPTSWVWTITPNTFTYQNGTSANSQNPNVKFTALGTYTVKLLASNSGGADSVTQVNYITVQNPAPVAPTADFIADDVNPVATITTVTFTDQSSNQPTSRMWDITPNTFTFLNGTSATSTNPQVVFTAPGTYTVALTATNAVGANTKTRTNYITATAPPMAPVADFIADITTATTNTTVVSFTDLSANNPETRYWSFTPQSIVYQNNGNATTANPKVIFTAPGDYTVKLRVTNIAGKDSITKNAYIHVTGGSTAINETESGKNTVVVFPNPTGDFLNFDLNSSGKIKNVTIVSPDGKAVTSFKEIKNNRIDIRSLAKGIYLLRLELENGTIKNGYKFRKL